MNRVRATFIASAVAAAAVLLPAPKSEAGLFDWLHCVFNPGCPECQRCPMPVAGCATGGCPTPAVSEGAYCNPCPTPCATQWVRRSYMEPRTCMQRQVALESRPTYVRRQYWDPCSCRYQTTYECSASYVRRSYWVPVTSYVERSYLEPVTACPTGCPVTSPGSNDDNTGAAPTSARLRSRAVPNAGPSIGVSPTSVPNSTPTRFVPRPVNGSATRSVPLAADAAERVNF